jgi:ribokinase
MNNSSTIIWVIGSINTDMVVKAGKLPSPGETVLGGEFLINPGGKGANQAVAAARLGSAVAMVGCVGSDVFGDEAIAGLKDELVDCSHIYRDDSRASGVALISVDEKGENHIVVAPGANSALSLQHVEQSFNHIPDNALVMLQLEIPLNTVSHVLTLARHKNCKIILDPAPARELPHTVFQDLFLITPNQSEAAMLTGIDIEDINAAKTAAQQLLEMGVKNVALTLGGQGVIFASEQGIEVIAAPTVSALDSTAAGDCFNGALATALVKGATLSEAIKFACHAASIAVTRLGAQNAMPREQELNSFV